MPAIVISEISPNPVSSRGGTTLELIGTFPIGIDIAVTIDGSAAIGSPVRSVDGTSIRVGVPPMSTGLTYVVEADDGATSDTGPDLKVIERAWGRTPFVIRHSFPRWLAMGPRRLELEEEE